MRTCLSAAILMFVIPLFGEVGQWTLVYPEDGQTNLPESAFNADTTVIWDQLSFIYNAASVVRISKDGSVSEYPLPEIDVPQPSNGLESLYWDQLICVDGDYYSLLHFDGYPPFMWKKSHKLQKTVDFQTWEPIQLPIDAAGSARWVKLIPFKNILNIYYSSWIAPSSRDDDVAFQPFKLPYTDSWGTNTAIGPIVGTYGLPYLEGVFLPSKSAWYRFRVLDETIQIREHVENGEDTPYGQLVLSIPATEAAQFQTISSPDDQRIFLYGETATIIITDLSIVEFFQIPNHLIHSDEFRVDSIKKIFGWYYILGSVQIFRTKDFLEYEPVDLPNGEPLQNLVGFSGNIYGFSKDKVYRSPIEKGYLDSIEYQMNWYHADWLGWFQIIDEDLGDIDHLLLGDCWVKQENDQQYWLRTSTLGWIYIYKDWSPWFWRMDDGHWYWLDQDGWPPRAWDFDDQEWEELGT